MKKILPVFNRIAQVGTFVSLTGMILAVVIQVLARLLLPSAPNWTEEVARIFFIYMVAFGAGLAVRNDVFVKLDFLQYYISQRIYRALQVLATMVLLMFSAGMVYYGWEFTVLGAAERSPALLISMAFVFFSMELMMVSIMLFSAGQLYVLLTTNPNAS
jgi:TRAP-type transport system small permease protein